MLLCVRATNAAADVLVGRPKIRQPRRGQTEPMPPSHGVNAVVIRNLKKAASAIFVLLIAAGCKPPETRIADLDPYVGARPGRITPLREPPKPAAKTPDITADRGWVPPGGFDDRWTCIVIHHSASDKSTPEGMRDWHVNGRHWDDLGYHFVIGNGVGYEDGAVFVGGRWTRQKHGAHCKTPDNHYNEHGIGICLIGNLNSHPPTAKQIRSLARLISFLTDKCHIPKSKVLTHGGVTHKTECPGRLFSLSTVMQQVSRQPYTASSR